MESILTSVKKLLGIQEEYTHFDDEIVMQINTALMSAAMIGIGPPEGYSIKDKTDSWEDFVGDRKDLEAIKTYIWHKVRLAFDPPQTGPLTEAINNQIKELEWRLNVQVERGA